MRKDADDEDSLVWGNVVAARRHLEETYNRCFVSRKLLTTVDRFPRYSSSAVWQYNSDAIWQQRLPVTQLSGQWYPDRASIRVTRPPMQQLLAITYTDGNQTPQFFVNCLTGGVSGPGPQTVTPETMIGVVVGLQIVVDVGALQETVTVTAVTTTTFTATFAIAHPCYTMLYASTAITGNATPLNGGAVVDVDTTTEPARIAPGYGQIWPIVMQRLETVQVRFVAGYGPVTTVAAAIPAGVQTVTPASMFGIFVGSLLCIDRLNPNLRETVQVTAVTGTTYTAAFGNAHNSPATVEGDLPEEARNAVKMLAAHWQEFREAGAERGVTEVPFAVKALMMGLWPGEYE